MKVFKKAGKIIFNIILLGFSLLCIFPLIWIIYSSFKTKDEFMLDILSLPKRIRFDNYISAIFDGKLYINFLNSAIISTISVTLVIVFAFAIGYVISRYQFRGRGLVYTLFLAGMLTPIYALIVPLFVQLKTLGMDDKPYTLIIPYIAIRLPLSIFLFESFIKAIPWELEEAAYMDGASIFRIMGKIIFPVCRPVMSTVLILAFLDTWNEFPFALTLVMDTNLRTVPVGLTGFSGQFTSDYTVLMAALVLSSLPVIIVYLLFSKKIIQGMTAGAVKG